FGFDEENLELLGDEFLNCSYISGTSYNLGKVVEAKIKRILREKVPENILANDIKLFPTDVAKFFKEFMYLQ
ncbi:hypothetical protein ACFLR5_00550, partial [Elusimicrobiota bacterium]